MILFRALCAASLIAVFCLSSAQAATYLHIGFFTDENCQNYTYAYSAIASSPRGSGQFVSGVSNTPIYADCPLDALPGAYTIVYAEFQDEFDANITLNQCAQGQPLDAYFPTVKSYFATCSATEFPPSVMNRQAFVETYYWNQSVCETKQNWSRRRVYSSGVCSVQNYGSVQYSCRNATHVDVLICSNTNCTDCSTNETRPISTLCSGGPGGITLWSDEACIAPPAPAAAPMAPPTASPVASVPNVQTPVGQPQQQQPTAGNPSASTAAPKLASPVTSDSNSLPSNAYALIGCAILLLGLAVF